MAKKASSKGWVTFDVANHRANGIVMYKDLKPPEGTTCHKGPNEEDWYVTVPPGHPPLDETKRSNLARIAARQRRHCNLPAGTTIRLGPDGWQKHKPKKVDPLPGPSTSMLTQNAHSIPPAVGTSRLEMVGTEGSVDEGQRAVRNPPSTGNDRDIHGNENK